MRELDNEHTNYVMQVGRYRIPIPFGRLLSPAESFIHEIGDKTSTSLKFTVVIPKHIRDLARAVQRSRWRTSLPRRRRRLRPWEVHCCDPKVYSRLGEGVRGSSWRKVL